MNIITTQQDIHTHLRSGASIVSATVGATLGAGGRLVLSASKDPRHKGVHFTKDGVSVAKMLQVDDGATNLVVSALRDASLKTAVCGDGTTSTALLGANLLLQLVELPTLPTGAVRRGLETAAAITAERIKAVAVPCVTGADIAAVARTSANGDDELVELITQAYASAGADGFVKIEKTQKGTSAVEVQNGITIERGLMSELFVTDKDTQTCALSDGFLLITNKAVHSIAELLPVLEKVVVAKKSLTIITPEISNEALQAIVQNNSRGVTRIVVVKAEEYGDFRLQRLEDLALTFGTYVVYSEARKANVVNSDGDVITDYAQLKLEDLGKANVFIDASKTVLTHCNKPTAQQEAAFAAHVQSLREQITQAEADGVEEFLIAKMKARLAKVSGGIATIRIGGVTEGEIIERYDRAEDAVRATAAALKSGTCDGGGVTLARASLHLVDEVASRLGVDKWSDECRAADAFAKALCSIQKRIVQNAGSDYDSNTVLQNTLAGDVAGWDARAMRYVARDSSMRDAGIIDAAQVLLEVVKNATSVCTLLISAGSILV